LQTFASASRILFTGADDRVADNMHQLVDRLAHPSRHMVCPIVERPGCRRTPTEGTIADEVGPEHAGVPKAARIIGSLNEPKSP
jgi:hypothetical protein